MTFTMMASPITLRHLVMIKHNKTTPISDAKPSDELSIKLGIISSSNTLVDLLWEYQSIHSSTPHNLVQSVELNDLNNDQSLDIIINYSDPDSEFPDQTISSF